MKYYFNVVFEHAISEGDYTEVNFCGFKTFKMDERIEFKYETRYIHDLKDKDVTFKLFKKKLINDKLLAMYTINLLSLVCGAVQYELKLEPYKSKSLKKLSVKKSKKDFYRLEFKIKIKQLCDDFQHVMELNDIYKEFKPSLKCGEEVTPYILQDKQYSININLKEDIEKYEIIWRPMQSNQDTEHKVANLPLLDVYKPILNGKFHHTTYGLMKFDNGPLYKQMSDNSSATEHGITSGSVYPEFPPPILISPQAALTSTKPVNLTRDDKERLILEHFTLGINQTNDINEQLELKYQMDLALRRNLSFSSLDQT